MTFGISHVLSSKTRQKDTRKLEEPATGGEGGRNMQSCLGKACDFRKEFFLMQVDFEVFPSEKIRKVTIIVYIALEWNKKECMILFYLFTKKIKGTIVQPHVSHLYEYTCLFTHP